MILPVTRIITIINTLSSTPTLWHRIIERRFRSPMKNISIVSFSGMMSISINTEHLEPWTV